MGWVGGLCHILPMENALLNPGSLPSLRRLTNRHGATDLITPPPWTTNRKILRDPYLRQGQPNAHKEQRELI